MSALRRRWVLGVFVAPWFNRVWAQTLSGARGSSATQSGSPPAPISAPDGSTGDTAPVRNVAGKINLVDGQASIYLPDQSQHPATVGETLHEGDAVSTGEGTEVHIDMADGGFVAVRPNSQLRLFKYQANGDDTDHSVMGLIKGSLRSITGWIGHNSPRNYAVVTPTATIGVRGTDHEPAYIAEEGGEAEAGTYDTVHAGATTISNPHGHIDVTPDHAGFVDRRGMAAPRLLPAVPRFFLRPRRHDAVFVGKHDAIMRTLTQKRLERQQQFREEIRRNPRQFGARPGLQGNARPNFLQRGQLNAEQRRPVPNGFNRDVNGREMNAREPIAREPNGREAAMQAERARAQANAGTRAGPESKPSFFERLRQGIANQRNNAANTANLKKPLPKSDKKSNEK